MVKAEKKWLPRWFYQLASPRWCYQICGKLLPGFSFVTLVLLLGGTLWALLFAPADYQQGNSFRIIYLHVPAASVAMALAVGWLL